MIWRRYYLFRKLFRVMVAQQLLPKLPGRCSGHLNLGTGWLPCVPPSTSWPCPGSCWMTWPYCLSWAAASAWWSQKLVSKYTSIFYIAILKHLVQNKGILQMFIISKSVFLFQRLFVSNRWSFCFKKLGPGWGSPLQYMSCMHICPILLVKTKILC